MRIILSAICPETGNEFQLALYYLKSYLHKNFLQKPALSVDILTFTVTRNTSAIAKQIVKLRPQAIGFSCYLWNIEKTLSVCRKLKKANPKLIIVLGGPEVTPRAEEILIREKAVSAVVRGEGEVTFSELARKKFSFYSVKGVSFRHKGEVIHNPERNCIADLNNIPSPYLNGTVDFKDKHIIDLPLETTRGCAFRCAYCYYHKNFPAIRYFPLSRVKKELMCILSHKPKELYLMDATFNTNLQRAKKILKFFIQYNRGSSLHVELKAELVDEELARLLGKARALHIEIGIQSTNQKTLKVIQRHFHRERFKKGIELLNKHQCFYDIQLIDALPYQSYDDLKVSLDWLIGIRAQKIVIIRMALLPGTELRQNASKFGIVYDQKAPYYALCSNAMSTADLEKVEDLCAAMEQLYDSRVFQETLFLLCKKGKFKASAIFEEWTAWKRHSKDRRCGGLLYLEKKLPAFLRYICYKYDEQALYACLLPGLLDTLREYRLSYYRECV